MGIFMHAMSPARSPFPSASPGLASADQRLILIVDDDEAVLSSLKFSLEVEGFQVLVFRSAEDLLKLPVLPASSCLVVDQKLPGKSGLQLIAELRAHNIPLPAILITSVPSAAVRREAATADVAIVEKPLLGNALSEAILHVLH